MQWKQRENKSSEYLYAQINERRIGEGETYRTFDLDDYLFSWGDSSSISRVTNKCALRGNSSNAAERHEIRNQLHCELKIGGKRMAGTSMWL